MGFPPPNHFFSNQKKKKKNQSLLFFEALKVAKVCARGSYVQCMTNAWKMHVGQGVLNAQPMNQTCF